VKRAPTNFSVLFDRGDLGVKVSHEGAANGIKWNEVRDGREATGELGGPQYAHRPTTWATCKLIRAV